MRRVGAHYQFEQILVSTNHSSSVSAARRSGGKQYARGLLFKIAAPTDGRILQPVRNRSHPDTERELCVNSGCPRKERVREFGTDFSHRRVQP